jgi:hypothetical protein
MATRTASGPPRPHNLSLVIHPQRGPLAPFGVPGSATAPSEVGVLTEVLIVGSP